MCLEIITFVFYLLMKSSIFHIFLSKKFQTKENSILDEKGLLKQDMTTNIDESKSKNLINGAEKLTLNKSFYELEQKVIYRNVHEFFL